MKLFIFIYLYVNLSEALKYFIPTKTTSKTDEEKCGISTPLIRHKIANGRLADSQEWPWNVKLIINDKHYLNSNVHCGGTIISKDTIITAAHCFDSILVLDDVLVYLYFDSIRLFQESLRLTSSKVKIHPKYIPAENYLGIEGPLNDIALIKFDFNSLTNSEFIVNSLKSQIIPVCLPNLNNYDQLTQVGTQAKILGYGHQNEFDELNEDLFLKNSNNFTLLQSADVYLSSLAKCKSNFESNRVKNKINSNTLCITGRIHPCLGDSGSALLVYYEYKWNLIGITSFAVSKSNYDKCGKFLSVVFARVSSYLNWILSNL